MLFFIELKYSFILFFFFIIEIWGFKISFLKID